MKKLKVMMMTLMMCLVSMSVWGQDERMNRPNLFFEQESDKLTEAIGWYYHESNGEWIDYKNVILDSKIYKENNSYPSDFFVSHKEQNFISIQTKSLKYKENTFYVLIINQLTGSYRYPTIKEDWEYHVTTMAYIFTLEEYQKLYTLNGIFKLNPYTSTSTYNEYKNEELLDGIQTALINKENFNLKYHNGVMKLSSNIFNVKLTNDNKVRFLLPESFLQKTDFTKNYFETSLENFNKILIKK